METIPTPRTAIIEELNQLTEKKWDLIDQLGELEVARAALFNRLREEQNGNIR